MKKIQIYNNSLHSNVVIFVQKINFEKVHFFVFFNDAIKLCTLQKFI